LIGLFVTALVGVYTIEDLWHKYGDLKLSFVSNQFTQWCICSHLVQRDQLWHWGARVFCLIIVPILVYMACFKMHFMVLNHSGPGDAQMSSLFQANLVGNDFARNPLGELTCCNLCYLC
jgi:dolichyl-phosphate-mannose-protein mannosyltransferase